ncbi:MAG TPA: DNA polymerase I [Bacteroidetes bacterium]|nr:DNA polymerase I [Bacteroidota bacterium]
MKKKLFLLDGSYLVYRSYFAFIRHPLINSKGENTSAAFGFTNSLHKVIKTEKPDYLAVIFDTPEPTFRHKLYPEYKATREKTPEEMIEQLPRIREVVEAFGIPIIEIPGYEADDIMATLAVRGEKQGFETYLLTGDKDLFQLVTSNIFIYKPGRSGDDVEIVTADWVREKWQVNPKQVRDVLALAGDSSDNIPGVPKIGNVTAKKLVNRFGSFENLLANKDQVEPLRIKESLLQNIDVAKLSYELVTIDRNVAVDIRWDQMKLKEPDKKRLAALFKELEFRSLSEEFMSKKEKIEQNYQTISTEPELKQFIQKLSGRKFFIFDLETTNRDPLLAELVGLSFSWQEGEAFYIPVKETGIGKSRKPASLFDSTENDGASGFSLSIVLPVLKKILENEEQKKCGQNIKYDMLVLKRYGVEVKGVRFDTMVASYLIDPSNPQHNLDHLCLEYLNYEKIPTKKLIGTGKNQITMREVPVEKAGFYACEDADFTMRLQKIFEPKLKSAGLYDLFREVEIPLIDVLKQMEWNGVSLDKELLKNLSVQITEDLIQLEKSIYHEAGQQFNINSTQQLGTILFDKLQLPVARKTKTGYSTDVTVLEKLSKIHPLPQQILNYRQLAKLKSTYVDALMTLINPYTGRLHTSYNQTVAATGRLSSSNPNLQNIPIRTGLGKQIRKAFVAGKPDCLILDADYSQIELRIMAHLSGDETLLQTFVQDLDVHTATAAQIFDIPLDEVNRDHRRKAKEINFGIMYGMGRFGLSNRLDISIAEAEVFIDNYFDKYPKVREFIDRTIEDVRQKGYVTTLMNRRRYLPEINSENRRVREFAERTAINTPIQGTAADLIKVAMINIHEKLVEKRLKSIMTMQVHDELVFEVPRNELEEMREVVTGNMESALELKVPIKIDMGTGKNWLEAH